MDYNQSDTDLTVKIVSKYVAHHTLASSQLSDLITTVHQAIRHLGRPVEVEEAPTPAVSVRRSVQQDFVICLDCGYRGKTLRRHINVRHGLTPDEYRQRWGLRSNHPITAPAYSERRSTMSKALGLGRKPSIQVPPPPTPVAAEPETQTTPGRKPRTRRLTKPAGATTSEAVSAAPTPARRGRPRSRAGAASQP
jgi:predicted transcriptional regulator